MVLDFASFLRILNEASSNSQGNSENQPQGSTSMQQEYPTPLTGNNSQNVKQHEEDPENNQTNSDEGKNLQEELEVRKKKGIYNRLAQVTHSDSYLSITPLPYKLYYGSKRYPLF